MKQVLVKWLNLFDSKTEEKKRWSLGKFLELMKIFKLSAFLKSRQFIEYFFLLIQHITL